MPRICKRRATRKTVYTDEHIEALTTGNDWFNSFGTPAVGESRFDDHPDIMAKKLEAWELFRDELMEQWIAARPFTRPWAWWKFDAPERRQRIDGNGPHPHDHPAWPADRLPKQLTFGTPRMCCVVPGDVHIKYETEREYLERLDLLTDHEKTLPPQPTARPAANH